MVEMQIILMLQKYSKIISKTGDFSKTKRKKQK